MGVFVYDERWHVSGDVEYHIQVPSSARKHERNNDNTHSVKCKKLFLIADPRPLAKDTGPNLKPSFIFSQHQHHKVDLSVDTAYCHRKGVNSTCYHMRKSRSS